MNEVPSVAYPVGRSHRLGILLLVLWLAGAVIVLAWWADQASNRSALGWRLGLLMLALTQSGVGLYVFWRNQLKRCLAFDGDRWHLSSADVPAPSSEPVQVTVLWDAQRSMLLHWPAMGDRKSVV